MSTAQMNDVRTPAAGDSSEVQFRLEVVVVPVADYDRAREFFTNLGWRVDADVDGGGGYRLMQLTPPGSAASVIFGTQVTVAAPGSLDGLLLAVDDIEAARSALMARGVSVSEAFHDVNGGLGGGFHIGDEGRAYGPDPERRSYATYASFNDSEGNRWILQELTTRLPGRVDEDDADVDAFATLLRETSEHHDTYEQAAAKHDWWDWYAAYALARRHGSTSDQAVQQAGRHMAEHKGIPVP
jgi:catechol 2,3-dioxygenase-like lactoylglutathione lyase family enzyme